MLPTLAPLLSAWCQFSRHGLDWGKQGAAAVARKSNKPIRIKRCPTLFVYLHEYMRHVLDLMTCLPG